LKVTLILIGKTTEAYLQVGITLYEKRLKNYLTIKIKVIPELKNTSSLSTEQQKKQEGKLILDSLSPGEWLVLMDEQGLNPTSMEFSKFLQKQMLQSTKALTFVIGGPYGFSPEVYQRANDKISLSRMTFSHQMVRLIFLEQLYRAMTILKNEPYHH
jgi:23S rRNA (pseudouridine1915-N3)-methyltransferase